MAGVLGGVGVNARVGGAVDVADRRAVAEEFVPGPRAVVNAGVGKGQSVLLQQTAVEIDGGQGGFLKGGGAGHSIGFVSGGGGVHRGRIKVGLRQIQKRSAAQIKQKTRCGERTDVLLGKENQIGEIFVGFDAGLQGVKKCICIGNGGLLG